MAHCRELHRSRISPPGRTTMSLPSAATNRRFPVTDAVDTLATDYQELRLRTFPTWAHMIGDYRNVDRFEEVSREAEDRQIDEAREFAARAEAIPADGLSA